MGHKRIYVHLDRQKLMALEGDRPRFTFDCVSGDARHTTEKGLFEIFRKERLYVSKTYHVPMNYAMFFTRDGKAIHMSHLVGPLSVLKSLGIATIGSHGCVRLAQEDAIALFDWAPLHTRVEITN